MLNQIYVIDDAIDLPLQLEIEQALTDRTTIWYFQKDVAFNVQDPKAANIQGRTPGLSHVFFEAGEIKSPLYQLIIPVVLRAYEKIGITPTRIWQARSFMHFPLAKELRREYDNIHVDLPEDHLVCLYYVNDTDGDTFIFDRTFDDVPIDSDYSTVKWNILQRISPRRGRCVLFDGRYYHSSSGPTSDIRCIINFDVA